jgi:peptide/nickel transport system permease protein
VTIILSIFGWTTLARTVRGKLLSLREEDYVMAAKLDSEKEVTIISRYMLPGFTSYIIVSLTLAIPAMILGETALSFLGVGLRPPTISWGVLLQDTQNLQAVAQTPWLLWPCAFVILAVMMQLPDSLPTPIVYNMMGLMTDDKVDGNIIVEIKGLHTYFHLAEGPSGLWMV